jgi:hypothetical protein
MPKSVEFLNSVVNLDFKRGCGNEISISYEDLGVG